MLHYLDKSNEYPYNPHTCLYLSTYKLCMWIRTFKNKNVLFFLYFVSIFRDDHSVPLFICAPVYIFACAHIQYVFLKSFCYMLAVRCIYLCHFGCFHFSPFLVCYCVCLRIGQPRPWIRPAVGLVWLLVHLSAPGVTPLRDSKTQREPTVSLWGK